MYPLATGVHARVACHAHLVCVSLCPQERLVECSNDQAMLGRRLRRPDFSRMGNRSCWRNETLNGEPFVFEESWVMPPGGLLELDFVSPQRPYADALPLSNEDLEVRACGNRRASLHGARMA